jgi:hypothetical protein
MAENPHSAVSLGALRARRARGLCAAVLALGLLAACGEAELLSQGKGARYFLAIDRNGLVKDPDGGSPDPGPRPTEESFYIALHKGQLGQKWFLSAFIRDLHPLEALASDYALGTRVVTFKVQNGKLFMFDVDDRKKVSDTFDPEVVIEAYPLVDVPVPPDVVSDPDAYVVFDPAAGMNRFSLLSDAYANAEYGAPTQFRVDLSYLRAFEPLADGANFEQVFTGLSAEPVASGGAESNAYRVSGTLGLSLRKYFEGERFEPVESEGEGRYFETAPHQVPNVVGGAQRRYATKWNFRQGMAPVTWQISSQFAEVAARPEWKGIDLIGAVSRGIEAWNEALGYRALDAKLAAKDASFASEGVNAVVLDQAGGTGALAQSRENPNTGEIRGGMIYVGGVWLEIALYSFTDDAAPEGPTPPPGDDIRYPKQLTWGPLGRKVLCMKSAVARKAAVQVRTAVPALTRAQKVERLIAHVVMHEMGHVLGLRHNFKGSLEPVSSSVMDYLLDEEAIALDKPGPYDVAALRHLYGRGAKPSQPFCSDEQTVVDPDCAQHDLGKDPLRDFHIPSYQETLERFLRGASTVGVGIIDYSLNDVLGYVRRGSPEKRGEAWAAALGPSRAPLAQSLAADPTAAARADQVAREVFSRLYLDPAPMRGVFVNDPPKDPAFVASVIGELKANLLNVDGVRSFDTRRVCIDVLKRLQTIDAYRTLSDARASLAATVGGLAGDEKLYTEDLVARIDRAINPYFLQ